MRDYITIDYFANLVSMFRADIDGAIVLIDDESEGQFYEKCIDHRARLVSSHAIAFQLFEVLKARQIAGIATILSAPQARADIPDSVFQSSFGDVVSLLLNSGCCKKVLEEIGGANWLRACDKEVGSFIDRIIALAWSIENICVSEGKRLPLDKLSKLINWQNLEFSDNDVCFYFSATSVINIANLFNVSSTKTRVELLEECNGVIAVKLFSEATKYFYPRGLQPYRQTSESEFIRMMRLAFDLADLEFDKIYWQIRAWERANHKFPLLYHWRILDPLQVVLDQRYWESDIQKMLANDLNGIGMTAIKC